MNKEIQYLNVPNPTGLSCLCRMPWAGPHLIFAYPSGPGFSFPWLHSMVSLIISGRCPHNHALILAFAGALSSPFHRDRAVPSVPLPKAFPLSFGISDDFHSLLCSNVTKISFLTILYNMASSLSSLSHCPRIFFVVIAKFNCLFYLFVYMYVVGLLV